MDSFNKLVIRSVFEGGEGCIRDGTLERESESGVWVPVD